MKLFITALRLLSIVLLSVLLGCKPSSKSLLDEAEKVMGLSVDSAYFMLSQIDNDGRQLKGHDRARYDLLRLYMHYLRASFVEKGFDTDSLFHSVECELRKLGDKERLMRMKTFQLYVDRFHWRYDSLAVHLHRFENEFSNVSDTLSVTLLGYKSLLALENKAYAEALHYADSAYTLAPDLRGRLRAGRFRIRVLETLNDIHGVDSCYQSLLHLLSADKKYAAWTDALKRDRLSWLQQSNRWEEAAAYSRQIKDSRSVKAARTFYLRGCAYHAIGRLDSARYYFLQASQLPSLDIAELSLKSLIQLERYLGDDFSLYYERSLLIENDRDSRIDYKSELVHFKEEQLARKLIQNKMARQEEWLYFMGIVILLLVATIVMTLIYFKEKRQRMLANEAFERQHLEDESRRLKDQNLMLQQENELTRLREQDAVLKARVSDMREMIFRKLDFYSKLSSKKSDKEKASKDKIRFTERDWIDVKLATDAVFDGFSRRLKETYPLLTDADVVFCALVKLNVNIQDLANIYCVTKAAISKRKLRIKNEKIGVADAEISLDTILARF